ncbi:zinc ribbon domain-containing protein [Persicirhabdus sediminis]|uniref:zinc ribbon domain-containing protein n=1 Tax=Persicirhabdus sediminis TaxID=454144 RepID=UPI001F41B565|nr:zinc ribbon domain-containing protein [Persicirhabdus sediminis]
MKNKSTAIDSARLEKAKEIANNPAEYKVCEGCDSIVGSATVICPNCHGYRFDGSADRVVDQAVYLGVREQTSVTAEDMV